MSHDKADIARTLLSGRKCDGSHTILSVVVDAVHACVGGMCTHVIEWQSVGWGGVGMWRQ